MTQRLDRKDKGDNLSSGKRTGSSAIMNRVKSELTDEYNTYLSDWRKVAGCEIEQIILLGGDSEMARWFTKQLSTETLDLIEYFRYKHLYRCLNTASNSGENSNSPSQKPMPYSPTLKKFI